MKKPLIPFLFILLMACNPSNDTTKTNDANTTNDTSKTTEVEPKTEAPDAAAYIDMKSLFSLSPLSIFDETTEGLSVSEKNDLIQKGESAAWKITDESKTKLAIRSKQPSSEVTLHFFKNKANLDGVVFAQVVNEQNTKLHSWKFSNEAKSLQKADLLKKYAANDFVSKEDKLPDSYQSVLNYEFTDEQTIEVSLQTWMEKEFENREIVNRIFLEWNGEDFEEQIVKKGQGKASTPFSIIDKPNYDLSKLNHDGKMVNKKFWQDANGENIVLFTQNKEELFVYHYAINADEVKLLRRVNDFERDCDYDLTLEFVDNAIQVTDLDKNNLGEITFAYKKACISDVSPKGLKLIILENGDKFIIRGSTSIDKPGIKVDGSKNVDSSFDNAPDNFLSHANKIWEGINKAQ